MKKLLVLVVLCVALTAIFFGCGGGSSEKSGKVVITFATGAFGSEPKLAKAIKEKFEASHPDIEVNLVFISGNYFQKILTMIAGGTPPDMFWMPHGDQAIEFMKRGALMELGPLMDSDPEFQEIKKDIEPRMYRNSTFNGKIFGQPIWLGTYFMFYNKDLFDEQGIPYPDGSWDWDEFRQICQKLTSEEENIYGFYVGPDVIYSMICSNGGQRYDTEKIECLFNTPEVTGAYQLAYDFVHKYKISPTPGELVGVTKGAPMWEGFMAEELAIVYQGQYMIDFFKDIEDFEWGVVLPPRGKKGNAPFLVGINFGIYRETSHPKETWEFMKFYLSKEAQELIYEIKIDIPVLTSVQQSDTFLNGHCGPEINKVILESLQYNYRFAKFDTVVFGKQWNDYVNQQVGRFFLGKQDVKTLCNTIVKEFNKRKKQIEQK